MVSQVSTQTWVLLAVLASLSMLFSSVCNMVLMDVRFLLIGLVVFGTMVHLSLMNILAGFTELNCSVSIQPYVIKYGLLQLGSN